MDDTKKTLLTSRGTSSGASTASGDTTVPTRTRSLSPSKWWVLSVGFVFKKAFFWLPNHKDDDVQAITEGMGLSKLIKICLRYRKMDFVKFEKEHWEAFHKATTETRNFGPCVCHYYEIMSDLITVAAGPYWHFVPWLKGSSRAISHERFHNTVVQHLDAKPQQQILELGAGYGECGRRVAHYSGAHVTSLTLAECEVQGGTERIRSAGLEKQCQMVQGDYHDLSKFADGSLDAVFGIYTLKYTAKLDVVMKEAHRVLRPGGKFVSYEILIDDSHDPENAEEERWINWISWSTGMPPLWYAKDFRDTARKIGFIDPKEEDIFNPKTDMPWYSVLEGVFWLMECSAVRHVIRIAESLGIVGKGFTVFYDTFLVHPVVDFVKSGRKGVVTGTRMMTWRKG